MIVWRGPGGQPVHNRRLGAATSVLPLPERQPDAPGQFAFANDQRVRGILRDSGWNGIELRPLDIPCARPQSKLVGYDRSSRRGAAERRQRTRAQVHGDEVHFIAACWMVTAPLTTLSPEATPVTGEPFLRPCAVNCAVIVTPHDTSGDTGQN
jgi:hypothetical protein